MEKMIELVSVFTAVAAALIAARAAKSAERQAKIAYDTLANARIEVRELKRQSEIAVHDYRLKIFNAFVEYRFALEQSSSSGKVQNALSNFYPLANTARFYFSEAIASMLDASIKQSLDVEKLSKWIADAQGASDEELSKFRTDRSKLYSDLVEFNRTIEMELRTQIQVISAQ